MITKTVPPDVEAEGLAELQGFIERTMPSYLRADSPVPESWPYSVDAWRQRQDEARAVWAEQAVVDWVRDISIGWTPREKAQGPREHQRVRLDGAPIREPEPDLPPSLQAEASRALREASARNLRLDEREEVMLRRVAAGYGNEQTARGVVRSIQSQVQAHDAAQRAAQREQDTRPVLSVRYAFRARGRSYAISSGHRISPEEASDLMDWQTKMEADQQRHGWLVPAGFAEGQWPPFVVEAP